MPRKADRIRSINNQIKAAGNTMVAAMSGRNVTARSAVSSIYPKSKRVSGFDRPIIVLKKINLGDEVTRQSVETAAARVRLQLSSDAARDNVQNSTFRSHDKKMATISHQEQYTSKDFHRYDFKRQRRLPKGSRRVSSLDLRREFTI